MLSCSDPPSLGVHKLSKPYAGVRVNNVLGKVGASFVLMIQQMHSGAPCDAKGRLNLIFSNVMSKERKVLEASYIAVSRNQQHMVDRNFHNEDDFGEVEVLTNPETYHFLNTELPYIVLTFLAADCIWHV